MATIAEIDLGKLLPYAEGRRKSFEELLYQLAYSQYKVEIESGKYSITSIDDSGGGDGVEFYITKDDGKIIGWQAKYFRETRFGPSQRTQAQRSLQKAHSVHGDNLKEWILCSRGAFGVDGKDDESTWFKNIGSKIVDGESALPKGSTTKATHWGESEIHRRLAENPNIQNYFFNEKVLTQEWFSGLLRQYEADDRVAKKYIPDVHVDMDEDRQLYQLLGYPEFKSFYEAELSRFDVRENCKNFDRGYEQLLETTLPDEDHEAFRQELLKIATPEKKNVARKVFDSLDALCDMVTSDGTPSYLYDKLWDTAQEQYREYDKFVNAYDRCYKKVIGTKLADLQYDETTDFSGYSKDELELEQEGRKHTRDLFGFYDVRLDAFLNIFRCFQSVGQPELHVSGAAGHGKTHLAFHTFKSCVESNRPALFMLAKDLSSIEDIPKLANTPRDWDLNTLLGALEIAGRVAGVRIPIIVDGLNETTNPGSVWYDGIPRLVSMLRANYPHIVLITTYRSSYRKLLFESDYFEGKQSDFFSYPFARQLFLPEMDSELSLEAIQKYFSYYKIRLSSGYFPDSVFTHPLYLRLFCEAKNHDRLNEIIIPTISRSDTYGVFRDYIDLAASRIQRDIGDPRYGERKVHDTLLEIGLAFWNGKSRSISLKESRLSQGELSSYESEDLLLYRDYDPHTNAETISFTYDAVGGYIIALTLLEMVSNKAELAEYLASPDFRERITQTHHPLSEDILRALCTLTVERIDLDSFLFEVTTEEVALEYSFEEIFETDPVYLTPKYDIVQSFVLSRLKTTRDQSDILGRSESHWFEADHPFNFDFISQWLASLPMAERDLSWSEHIRINDEYFEELVDDFAADLRNGKQPANADLSTLLLTWLLTTTIHVLRDKSTQALYWYGRNNPEALFKLAKQFIGCNDPYVPERLLAALYGVAMASRGLPEEVTMKEFTDNLLPKIARYLYHAMFSAEATHPTTHILTRDYAKRTIDLALLSDPSILSADEQANIQYPLANYPHSQWDEMSNEEIEGFKAGAFPIRMDFDNYTIGRLIPSRSPYDSKNSSYKTVRANIYWRLKDLGFDSKLFSTSDSIITRLNSSARNSFEERSGKIDRYGKKYSWIAYFEMAGRLSDDEILKRDESSELAVRMSDIGIDPSFPALPTDDYYQRMGNVDLLGGDETEQWLQDTNDIGIQQYFLSKKVTTDKDEWVLIKARINQEDAEDQTRDTMIDISAILVDESSESKIRDCVASGKEFRFGIMEGSQAYYTFDGEIPWSPYVPSDNTEDLVIEYGTKFDVTNSLSIATETLFYSSEWESYHSQLNPSGATITPSKDFAGNYNLRLIPQTSDMCDDAGKVISKTAFSKLTPFGDAKFAYVRKDELLSYIGSRKLVWATWSEKRWWKDGVGSSTHRDTETDFVEHCRIDLLSDLLT